MDDSALDNFGAAKQTILVERFSYAWMLTACVLLGGLRRKQA